MIRISKGAEFPQCYIGIKVGNLSSTSIPYGSVLGHNKSQPCICCFSKAEQNNATARSKAPRLYG